MNLEEPAPVKSILSRFSNVNFVDFTTIHQAASFPIETAQVLCELPSLQVIVLPCLAPKSLLKIVTQLQKATSLRKISVDNPIDRGANFLTVVCQLPQLK